MKAEKALIGQARSSQLTRRSEPGAEEGDHRKRGSRRDLNSQALNIEVKRYIHYNPKLKL